MKNINKQLLLLCVSLSMSLFKMNGQEINIKHKVASGETIAQIALKYQVTPSAILNLNPNASKGIKENEILLVPNLVKNKFSVSKNNLIEEKVITHIVKPKETKFGLSKFYSVSISELEQQNEQILKGLLVGQKLSIFTKKYKGVTHVVAPKESLYSISRKYGVSISDLIDANDASFQKVLLIGTLLNIPPSDEDAINYYLVNKGDTKYGLSRKYGMTISELESMNPFIQPMLITGQRIKLAKSESNITGQDNTSKLEDKSRLKSDTNVSSLSKQKEITSTVPTKESVVSVPKVKEVVSPVSTKEPVVSVPKVKEIAPPVPTKAPVVSVPKVKEVVSPVQSKEPVVSVPKAKEIASPVQSKEPLVVTSPKVKEVVSSVPSNAPVVISPKVKEVVSTVPTKEPVVSVPKAKEVVSPVPTKEPVVSVPKAKEVASPVQSKEPVVSVPKVKEIASLVPTKEPVVSVPKAKEVASPVRSKEPVVVAASKGKATTVNEVSIDKSVSEYKGKLISYEITPKETLYSLSKKTNLTPEQLIQINPQLANGLQSGMVVQIPENSNSSDVLLDAVSPTIDKEANRSLQATVVKTLKREVVFLLPFTLEQYNSNLKKNNANGNDPFYASSRDFFEGGLKALDSIKGLGLQVSYKVIEIKPNSEKTAIISQLKNNGISRSNMVFMPNYVNELAVVSEFLASNNVPIITNVQNFNENKYKDVLFAIPSYQFEIEKMLDYLNGKQENVIVVSQKDKFESQKIIKTKYPNIKIIDNLSTHGIEKYLDKSKLNYVVLDCDKSSMLVDLTNELIKQRYNYKIQLALLQASAMPNLEELSTNRLALFKLIYPSFSSKELSLSTSQVFFHTFKNKNLIFHQGFDITFDMLLRSFRNESIESTFQLGGAEYTNLQFKYIKRVSGYTNQTFYIHKFK
jgi:LysM repeat protein